MTILTGDGHVLEPPDLGERYLEKTGLRYGNNAPLGRMDPAERIQRLALENIERAFL